MERWDIRGKPLVRIPQGKRKCTGAQKSQLPISSQKAKGKQGKPQDLRHLIVVNLTPYLAKYPSLALNFERGYQFKKQSYT